MTDTRTLPVADLLGALDFDPPCMVGNVPGSEYEPCTAPAEWVAIALCCGDLSLYCNPHMRFVSGPAPAGRWRCSGCNKITPGTSALFERYSRVERIR